MPGWRAAMTADTPDMREDARPLTCPAYRARSGGFAIPSLSVATLAMGMAQLARTGAPLPVLLGLPALVIVLIPLSYAAHRRTATITAPHRITVRTASMIALLLTVITLIALLLNDVILSAAIMWIVPAVVFPATLAISLTRRRRQREAARRVTAPRWTTAPQRGERPLTWAADLGCGGCPPVRPCLAACPRRARWCGAQGGVSGLDRKRAWGWPLTVGAGQRPSACGGCGI